MSSRTYEGAAAPVGAAEPRFARDGDDQAAWAGRTRVVLTPIAAPSILGLFGFAGATFMVSAHMAGWFGNTQSPEFLFPFAAMFGGLAQFAAGIWSYRARDGLATAMHGMWGAFWLAYGILYSLIATGAITAPAGNTWVELGYWFIPLAAITMMGFFASLGESLGIASVLGPLAVGAAFAAIFFLTGISGWETAAGWVLQVSSWTAFYAASAMMLEESYGRTILPLGKYKKGANVPGGNLTRPIEYEHGMPGARVGQ
jgi:succinate-acetate transporter protein